jgi:hypothetical protein
MALSTLGAVSAAAGIAALGVSVAHSLDNLIRDIQEAPKTLILLSNQVTTFAIALRNLEEAEKHSRLPIGEVVRLSRQREYAIGGGYMIIRELENDIEDIRDVRRPQFKNRTGPGLEMSMREMLTKKWNDAHIEKWSTALHRQAAVLALLLER